jgi:signal transduction histidine kinase
MAALGNLVAGVAHEINTPLGVGITAASFLNEKTEEYIGKYKNGGLKRSDLEKYTGIASESSAMILTNLNRAADLVKSFKQVAVDQSTDERRKFNLKEYLDKLLFSLEPNFKKTKHTVTLNCPEDLVISSYPGVFSQIITNLIMNSMVHGFKEVNDGKIKIDIYKEENLIALCYTDNGMGMDTETLEKVFDPFFTTNRSSGGTGLGMHILYNLVTQSLGGQMECTSTPDKGVVFLIRIPCGYDDS